MTCPQCNGPIWDNAAKVATGWKGPLRKCQDEQCGWIQWLRKPKAVPKAATFVGERAPKWTWQALAETYRKCFLIAEQRLVAASKSGPKLGFATADVLQATATLFIEACRSGVKEPQPDRELEDAEV